MLDLAKVKVTFPGLFLAGFYFIWYIIGPPKALIWVISEKKNRKGDILQLRICSYRRINQVKGHTEHTAKHIS